MKNTLCALLGILSLSTTFSVAAHLIPITVGSNDTFTLATFMSDQTGKTYRIDQYSSKHISKETTTHPFPTFTWYIFDTTGYKGGNKIKRVIHAGTPHAFTITPYEHLAINEIATGDTNGTAAKAILQTMNAPRGTFKIVGINPMTGKINRNEGFIVTVK
jgi:hypothetical protein